jgi:hypothetical protein
MAVFCERADFVLGLWRNAMVIFCESVAVMVGLWWDAMIGFFVALSTIYCPISLDFQIEIALSATKWPLFLH